MLGVVIFTACYMLAALIATVCLGNSEFVIYFAIMCVLVLVVVVLHYYVNLSLATLWGLSAWGLAHFAGGLMPIPNVWPRAEGRAVLYNWWIAPDLLKYDQLVHALGFGLVTWICWQALRGAFLRRGTVLQPRFGLLTLCVAGGMGFGALNEVIEFVATRVLPSTNVGGYVNTGWDLVANLVGGCGAALLIFCFDKRPRASEPDVDADGSAADPEARV